MSEDEWLSETLACAFLEQAEIVRSDAGDRVIDEWRAVAARVACLQRLGVDTPKGVQRWIVEATAYLDEEDRRASAGGLLDKANEDVYQAFRDAYAIAGPDLQQRLAAAQDAFRGSDYYCYEEYLLEEDETSPTYSGPIYVAESAAHCDIIRDIFGNPFHPVAADPAWLTATVVALAEAIYAERAFERLPILADALEDAGCSEAFLSHLRGPGPHARGCYVLDVLLAKK
jgi:hypothetical protein